MSDGEIAEPVSRWGPPSEAAENSRNNSGGHNRENNSRDGNPGKPKEQPNLKLSGALAKETNMYRGVLINYSEPPEAKVPKKRWRFYPFKVCIRDRVCVIANDFQPYEDDLRPTAMTQKNVGG